MIRYVASWVVPVAGPPIRDGWIDVDRGRIMAVGHGRGSPDQPTEVHELGSVAILPGLVNAHTHLELTYLRGEVAPASEFVAWIRGIVAARRAGPEPRSPQVLSGIEAGIAEAVRCGTALVGDISNMLTTVEPLARGPLGGVVFYELIRFNASDAEGFVECARQQVRALGGGAHVRVSLAAHAPYSVAPQVLAAIRRAVEHTVPYSVHLSEASEEVEFIRTGGGPWRTFLHDIGAWDDEWAPHGGSPVEYLSDTGFLGERLLAVHGAQMTPSDLDILARSGATLVTCPRSNLRTGAGAPPIASFYRSGVRVAVGTDSHASTPDLNVFAELAEMRALAPTVPASVLLESATRVGAQALGFAADYGTLEPGKRARLLAVSIPGAIDDVEEYLVSGVAPGQLSWLDDHNA